jgi:hypothetical protein
MSEKPVMFLQLEEHVVLEILVRRGLWFCFLNWVRVSLKQRKLISEPSSGFAATELARFALANAEIEYPVMTQSERDALEAARDGEFRFSDAETLAILCENNLLRFLDGFSFELTRLGEQMLHSSYARELPSLYKSGEAGTRYVVTEELLPTLGLSLNELICISARVAGVTGIATRFKAGE